MRRQCFAIAYFASTYLLENLVRYSVSLTIVAFIGQNSRYHWITSKTAAISDGKVTEHTGHCVIVSTIATERARYRWHDESILVLERPTSFRPNLAMPLGIHVSYFMALLLLFRRSSVRCKGQIQGMHGQLHMYSATAIRWIHAVNRIPDCLF